MNFKTKIHKLTNWEYWSTSSIYMPMFPAWLYLSWRAKSLFFFNASNPSFPFGGMAMDSKSEIYKIIPEQYIPKTLTFSPKDSLEKILLEIKNKKMYYPLVAKPDIGLKGLGVEILNSKEELKEYLKDCDYDFIIQSKIPYENEIGIFYHRFPNEKKGKITGLVKKEFLSVTGNGKFTLRELISEKPRSIFQFKALEKRFGEKLDEIIPINEKVILIPFGSHTRGAEFIDISDKINENLVENINEICNQIPGFHYGRLDVMYNNLEELSLGKNFKIVEINGAKSEPTHMYDPKHSLFFAWKEIYKHWKIMQEIALKNHQNGSPYIDHKKGFEILAENLNIEKKLKKISAIG